MNTVIQVNNLKKTFKCKQKKSGLGNSVKSLFNSEYRYIDAVDNINFNVQKGELLAFIGPNGAGKSTTIKMITGILYPDSGSVNVLGLNPHKKRRQLSYKIGTVFGQKSQLWFHLPPADSLQLLGSIYDLSKKECQMQIDYLSEIFEMTDFIKQPVRKLSLGKRIRCEIAASMLHKPEILFLDEPSIGLDVVVKQKIRGLIKRVNEEDKVTVFLTSHDAGDIEKICKRAIVINDGTIVWNDSIKKMKYSLMNKRIIDLLLKAPLNFEMNGVKIIKSKEDSAKLEIDLSIIKLEEVIQRIMNGNKIKDINITNIPMEEIIKMIFEGSI